LLVELDLGGDGGGRVKSAHGRFWQVV
jgi:hypothetical protein